mgnify:CR=1 FL=1
MRDSGDFPSSRPALTIARAPAAVRWTKVSPLCLHKKVGSGKADLFSRDRRRADLLACYDWWALQVDGEQFGNSLEAVEVDPFKSMRGI